MTGVRASDDESIGITTVCDTDARDEPASPIQLSTKNTADILQGLPFIMIWTWGVVSAITVPFLTGLHVSEKKRSLMEATNQMQKRPPRLKLLQGRTLASASLHHDVALGRLRMIGR